MTTPMQWGHVARRALAPYHVRNAARRAYTFAPRFQRGALPRQGTGQLLNLMEVSAPGVAIYRHALSGPQLGARRAMGQPNSSNADVVVGGIALSAVALAALIAISVAVNYQLGKAMAPNKQVEGKWAWGNAIGGTIFPPFTLGMAIYKNYFMG